MNKNLENNKDDVVNISSFMPLKIKRENNVVFVNFK